MTIINVLFLKLNTTAKILESALVLCFISFSRPPRVALYRVLSRHYYDLSSRPSVVTLTSFLVFVELPGITLFSQTWWSCWSGLVVLLASSLGFDPLRRPRHDLHRANLFLQHAHTHTFCKCTIALQVSVGSFDDFPFSRDLSVSFFPSSVERYSSEECDWSAFSTSYNSGKST